MGSWEVAKLIGRDSGRGFSGVTYSVHHYNTHRNQETDARAMCRRNVSQSHHCEDLVTTVEARIIPNHSVTTETRSEASLSWPPPSVTSDTHLSVIHPWDFGREFDMREII